MPKDVVLYLDDISDSIAHIERYVADLSEESFLTDTACQDAVARRFIVIGEAVKRVPDEIREAHTDIPWREMAAFRDVLVHDYADISWADVWGIIHTQLPMAKQHLQILSSYLSD